jgi:hypothetical protein
MASNCHISMWHPVVFSNMKPRIIFASVNATKLVKYTLRCFVVVSPESFGEKSKHVAISCKQKEFFCEKKLYVDLVINAYLVP